MEECVLKVVFTTLQNQSLVNTFLLLKTRESAAVL